MFGHIQTVLNVNQQLNLINLPGFDPWDTQRKLCISTVGVWQVYWIHLDCNSHIVWIVCLISNVYELKFLKCINQAYPMITLGMYINDSCVCSLDEYV